MKIQGKYRSTTLLDVLPNRYKCELCKDLMTSPVQTNRGNSACQSCYFDAKRSGDLCPIDKQPIKSNQIFPDKAKKREIHSLLSGCINNMNGCDWNGKIKDLEVHLLSCEFTAINCVFCFEKYDIHNENKHFEKCVGIYKSGNCIHQTNGCSFVASNISEMAKHLNDETVLHSIYQLRSVRKQSSSEMTDNNIVKDLETKLLKKAQSEKEMETKMVNLQIALEQGDIKFEMFKQKCMEQFNNLQQEFMNLNNNQQDVRMIETNNLSSKSNELKTIANTVEENCKNIDNLDLRLQLHENTTYGGRILWKIDNYHSRKQQAVIGKVTALHSAPSFSSQYGYKFCLRMYLNGDGMGKGTHLSLFLVIMKSEYDNVLEWPFKKQVKFTLINQQNRSNDVVERMVPNKDSSSFQKPRKEMNIASGCPLFVAIDRLDCEGFVKDDSLFIDMKIE